jgi:hypothetical protein
VFSGFFIGEESDGLVDKGSECVTVVDIQTLLEAFLNMPLRSACFIDEGFLWKKTKLAVLGLLKCWIIRISNLLDIFLKEFCSIIILYRIFFLSVICHITVPTSLGGDRSSGVCICVCIMEPSKEADHREMASFD